MGAFAAGGLLGFCYFGGRFFMALVRRFPWTLMYLACAILMVLIISASYDRWVFYLLYYNHFLLYPLAYGWISVALVELATRQLRATGRIHQKQWSGVALLVCVFSVVVLFFELSGDDFMEFEGAPRAINAVEGLRTGIPSVLTDPTGRTAEAQATYHTALGSAVSPIWSVSSWPLSRFIYVLSFGAQAAGLLYVYVFCILLVRNRRHFSLEEDTAYRQALFMAGMAVMIVTFWVIMRSGFEQLKPYLLGRVDSKPSLYVIIFMQLLAGLCVVACFWFWLGERIESLVALLVTVGGGYIAWTRSDYVLPLFNGQAGLAPHLMVSGCILLTLWACWLFDPDGEGDSAGPGISGDGDADR